MMTVSTKGIYGMLAMVELAKSYHQGTRQIKEIAETHGIPQHYLEQIMVILKKAGLIESFRGAQGGYALAKDPSRIRLYDILWHLEGKLAVIPDQHRNSILGFFWADLEKALKTALEKNLEDLLLAQQKNQEQFIYTI